MKRTLALMIALADVAAAQAIPFDVDGHIFFTAHINGVAARLLYDPVDGVFLDRRFVQSQSGWHRSWRDLGDAGPTMVGGAGPAQVEVTFTDSLTVTVGNVTRTFPRAPVIPLDSMMSGAIAPPVHGLLGTTFFGDRAMRFDFRTRTAHLLDPASIDTTGWSVIPLTMLGARTIAPVTITIADTVSYTLRAAVDWGMAGTLRVTTATTNRLRLLRHAGGKRTTSTGLGGGLYSVELGNVVIGIGAVNTAPLDVDLARELSGGDANPPYDALLGLGVLSQFDVIHDRAGGRMLVRNRSDAESS